MSLEKKTGFGIVKVALIAGLLRLVTACPFPTDLDVTLHDADTGTLMGTTLIPTINLNKVEWVPQEDVEVEILGTDFMMTSTTDGLYAFDDVPSGSYEVKASHPAGLTADRYRSTVSTVVLDRQTTTTDIKMQPKNEYLDNQIVYGQIYSDEFRGSTFSGKPVRLDVLVNGIPENIGKQTTTSQEGEYAFYFGGASHRLISVSGETIYFFDEDGQANDVTYIHGEGVIERDAYVVPDVQ